MWYNNAMKKSLFIFLSFITCLTSCKKEATFSYEDLLKSDVSTLSSTTEFKEEPTYFTSTLSREEKNNSYNYTFIFENFTKDLKEVRTVIEFKNDSNLKYVFFGYETNYEIVSDKSKTDKEKNIVPGFAIYSTFDFSVDEVNVLFKSTTENVLYKKKVLKK